MKDVLHYYEATVTRVIDGDTIEVLIDLGFSTYVKKRLRLARINTPEIRGPEKEAGLVSKAYVVHLLPLDTTIVLHSLKIDSFGRAIAEVWYNREEDWINLSDHLVEHSYAESRSYN